MTTIEWTDQTWNPVTGCDWVSPGCDHCYARTLANRLNAMGNPRYQKDGYDRALKIITPGFGVQLHRDKLEEPYHWKKPRMVFVNSMSDLFHEEVPDDFIASVWQTMYETPQHTYQILTKRPRRMAELLNRWSVNSLLPLPNVWLGTSIEDQKRADLRLPLLCATPAMVRFLSCEPLLGPIDLDLLSLRAEGAELYTRAEYLRWVIVGGESGPKHRPMDLDWARNLRDQCVAAEVPFFFKQVGGFTPKAGGRELDGRTWDEMPA